MAILTLENGIQFHDLAAITQELEPLGVSLKHWPVGDDPELKMLLDRPALNDDEKNQVLAGLDHYFEGLQSSAGYQSRDLIVLHPGIPNLDELLTKFIQCHTHDDDEVRYIVGGDGTFGFVRPDGSQILLTVEAEEYINVPANTEHWFLLTEQKCIKAVRYFTGMDGWVPRYTGTETRI
jgi:1,2-dihydroxy-3-keto-5-methylthiopentene dioxygenase